MKSILAFLLALLGLGSVSLLSLAVADSSSKPVVREVAKTVAKDAAKRAVQRGIEQRTEQEAGQESKYPSYVDNYAIELLERTNTFRKQHGKPPVKFDPILQRAAQERTNAGYSHFIQGQDCYRGAKSRGFKGNSAGENIAYGQRNPYEAVDAWIHSPGHRANMLGNWTVCGMARAKGTNRWIQIFGHY